MNQSINVVRCSCKSKWCAWPSLAGYPKADNIYIIYTSYADADALCTLYMNHPKGLRPALALPPSVCLRRCARERPSPPPHLGRKPYTASHRRRRVTPARSHACIKVAPNANTGISDRLIDTQKSSHSFVLCPRYPNYVQHVQIGKDTPPRRGPIATAKDYNSTTYNNLDVLSVAAVNTVHRLVHSGRCRCSTRSGWRHCRCARRACDVRRAYAGDRSPSGRR